MKYIITGGRRVGRYYAHAMVCKHFPRAGMFVPDIAALDKMIALGVQPSQIMVASEQKPRERLEYVIDEGSE